MFTFSHQLAVHFQPHMFSINTDRYIDSDQIAPNLCLTLSWPVGHDCPAGHKRVKISDHAWIIAGTHTTRNKLFISSLPTASPPQCCHLTQPWICITCDSWNTFALTLFPFSKCGLFLLYYCTVLKNRLHPASFQYTEFHLLADILLPVDKGMNNGSSCNPSWEKQTEV